MGQLADCPYCGGQHRKKRAFTRCARSHDKPKWKRLPKKKRG